MAFQITGNLTGCKTPYPGYQLRKHQSSTLLALYEEIHLSPLDFPLKGPAMWKVLSYYEKNPNGKWPGYIKVHDRRYKCLAQLKSLEEFRISWIVIYRFVNKRKKSYVYTGIHIYIYIRVMCFHNFLQIHSLNDGIPYHNNLNIYTVKSLI